MQLTLQQLFGANASQDISQIIIQKSDLLGLTPATNNTAESLLVALILTAESTFEGEVVDSNGNYLADNQGNILSFDNSLLYEELVVSYWRKLIKGQKIIDQFVLFKFSNYVETN
ncbi:MAG: hypothetical protein RMX96_34895 [Nostoc sp. ChiSLP02]|nr:hypothetical protein [Nostoc sp. DedSLP05]MDZ8101558.1 hypothetical protein [Nostoc sp. DedSLP01]MDZ8190011.1 hypothetical protein [Nostoc sp. ChiSLP02]